MWLYDPPNAKSFLLCESTIFTWIDGDPAGRRFDLEDSSEPGIDLLRLELDQLRERYEASLTSAGDGSLLITLLPTSSLNPVAEARLRVDSESQRLLMLEYRDREGNATRFDIDRYEPLDNTERLEPPAEIEWLDD